MKNLGIALEEAKNPLSGTDHQLWTGEEFENALRSDRGEKYILRLYVTGMTQRSIAAIENVRRICEENLKGRYELAIIDICQNPEYAKSEDIIAAPTLIKHLPLPLRRFIGDMSNKERILIGMAILPEGTE